VRNTAGQGAEGFHFLGVTPLLLQDLLLRDVDANPSDAHRTASLVARSARRSNPPDLARLGYYAIFTRLKTAGEHFVELCQNTLSVFLIEVCRKKAADEF
jgi:hypothetical protein